MECVRTTWWYRAAAFVIWFVIAARAWKASDALNALSMRFLIWPSVDSLIAIQNHIENLPGLNNMQRNYYINRYLPSQFCSIHFQVTIPNFRYLYYCGTQLFRINVLLISVVRCSHLDQKTLNRFISSKNRYLYSHSCS